jgi:hypothetical protein
VASPRATESRQQGLTLDTVRSRSRDALSEQAETFSPSISAVLRTADAVDPAGAAEA